jgi:hypothetical protein
MNLNELKDLNDPTELSPALQALWTELRGDWDGAHNLAQAANHPDGDWVHAYLHRKDGDVGNAGYWYARAGRNAPAAEVSPAAEWDAIATELLAAGSRPPKINPPKSM